MAILARERLIVALDLPTVSEAERLVERLGEAVYFYKVGLELFCGGGYFELVDRLLGRGKKVFADLKFYDIPATVGRAVRNLSRTGVQFCTVHGDRKILEAAAENKGPLKVLAVTVLTSLDGRALREMGYDKDLQTLVLERAKLAKEAGVDGVIASAKEAAAIRETVGDGFLIVTPGIRPSGSAAGDQRRIATPKAAISAGSDYLVVGRPIRDAPDPKRAALAIQEEIADAFRERGKR